MCDIFIRSRLLPCNETNQKKDFIKVIDDN